MSPYWNLLTNSTNQTTASRNSCQPVSSCEFTFSLMRLNPYLQILQCRKNTQYGAGTLLTRMIKCLANGVGSYMSVRGESTTAWMQAVEQRRSSCRGSDKFSPGYLFPLLEELQSKQVAFTFPIKINVIFHPQKHRCSNHEFHISLMSEAKKHGRQFISKSSQYLATKRFS